MEYMMRVKNYMLAKWEIAHPFLYKNKLVFFVVCIFLAIMGISRYMGEAERYLLYYPAGVSRVNLFFGALEMITGMFGIFIIYLKEPRDKKCQ